MNNRPITTMNPDDGGRMIVDRIINNYALTVFDPGRPGHITLTLTPDELRALRDDLSDEIDLREKAGAS